MTGRAIRAFLLLAVMVLTASPCLAEAPAHGMPEGATGDIPRYEISVALLPEKGEFRGGVRIHLPDKGEKNPVHLIHMGQSQLLSATLNGRKLKPSVRDGMMRVKGGGELDILFGARFGDGAVPDGPDNSGVVRGNMINAEGAFLQSGWYPKMDGPGLYTLNVFTPDGFTVVSEADEARTESVEGGLRHEFSLDSPAGGITLVAGRYMVMGLEAGGRRVEAYFFPEDQELGQKYLARAAEYISMYEEMIGPFPFRRFAVVEGALPTGYSMPTYTLLGQGVVRLPFIVDTSLGHEVLHQWFGAAVGIGGGGNWAEGLTAYMADHLYEERKGKGAEHRKRLLLDYRNYVTAGTEIPLAEFVAREDLATRAVGYAKGAMVFHMLREELGQEAFMRGLREFYSRGRGMDAGWKELRAAFESASGRELGWFFSQWVPRKGAIGMEISDARPMVVNGTDAVSFVIRQPGTPREFLLPLDVMLEGGRGERHEVRVKAEPRQAFEVPAGGRPVELVLDPDYSLMRNLNEVEAPPTVSMLTGEEGVFVVPEEGAEAYMPLADAFRERGYSIVNEPDLSFDALYSRPAIIASAAAGILGRLLGAVPPIPAPGDAVALEVMQNPLGDGKALAVLWASSREEAESASGRITHYGRYSRLAFSRGRNTLKETAGSERGMRVGLALDVTGIRVRDALPLSRIIREAGRRRVIFIGEAHTSYEHHKVQLEFIRQLHEAGEDIAVGMEMFQTPFQNALDAYVRGELDERGFLRGSEYFTRWSYNWHLYREILDYARANSIPVIALNQRGEVIKKLSRSGLDALSPDERAQLPAAMDLTDRAYRERLREIFGRHSPGRAFDNFFLAQVVWDETMARTIAGYLGENPGRRMVVLTGQGHTAWRSGIPERLSRLTGIEYSLVIQNEEGSLDARKADYVLFAREMPEPEFPVIGVKVDKTEGGLLVDEVVEGGAAAEAGIRKGDLLVRAGGSQLVDLSDLKLVLYDMLPRDGLEVEVLRKRFLLGPVRIRLSLRLP